MSGWLTGGAIVQAIVASALLMGLVLVARKAVMRAFGPSVAYALWLLPALRLVLPPLPGWTTLAVPALYIGHRESTIGLIDPRTAVRLSGAPVPPPAIWHIDPGFAAAPVPAVLNWTALAFAVWLGGAAIFFAVQMLRYRRFLRSSLDGATLLARECGIDVLSCPALTSPVAAGLARRRILLPADFTRRFSAAERSLALRHEAAHHDRLDIFADLVAQLVLALHWWNPVAHAAYRAFRVDQEMACDATVLADAAAGDAETYGRAMVKSAAGRMPAMACALSHKAQLKQRIRMMAKGRIGSVRLLCGSALVLGAIGGGLLLTATGQAHMARPVAPVAPPHAPIEMAPPRAVPAPPAPPAEVEAAVERAEKAAEVAYEAAAESGAAAAVADAHAAVAAEHARRATANIPDVGAMVDASLAQARAELARSCAKQGAAVRAGADFGELATCGNHMQETILASLHEARNEVSADSSIDPALRAQIVTSLDRSIHQTRASLRRD